MFRMALESVLHRKLRFALTAIAVVLGVAFVAGTYMLTDTMNTAFTTFFSTADSKIDVVVQSPTGLQNNLASWGDRQPVPETLLGTVQAAPGVHAAEGQVVGIAQIVDPSGTVVTTTGAPTLGLSATSNPELDTANLRTGRFPTGADEVAIDANTARTHSIKVGDQVRVLFQDNSSTFRVVGIFGIGELDSMAGATVAAFDMQRAQAVLGKTGFFDSIVVKANPGVSQDQLRTSVQQAVGSRFEVITGQQLADRTSQAINDEMGIFSTALLIFAGIALFVGGFIIFNTFAVVVAQRTRELGLLRCLGCTTPQLVGALLIEALIIGVLASLAGLVLGIAVCLGLTRLLAAVGMELPPAPLQIGVRTVVASLLVGVLVTLVAALGPALRTRRLSPVEALVSGLAAPGPVPLRRLLTGILLTTGGFGLVLFGAFANIESRLLPITAGALGLFLGIAGLSPIVVRPLSGLLGWPVTRLGHVPGRLGRENAMRSPVRTARTASALMVGMALVSFVAIFGASLKASTGAALDSIVAGDYVLTGASQLSGFSPQAAANVRGLAQVERVGEIRVGYVERNGVRTGIGGASAADLLDVARVTVKAGDVRAIDHSASVAIGSTVATAEGLRVGDTVTLTFERVGTQRLPIAAIYDDSQGSIGQYLLGLPTFEKNFVQQLDMMAIVKLKPGVALTSGGDSIHWALTAYPNVKVQDRATYRQQAMDQIDQLLTLLYALLALALVIALVGIVNTLALATFERIRELGLLRAVGMARHEVRRMVEWEAAIVSLLGALVGVVVGLVLAWVALKAMASSGLGVISIPSVQLVVFVVVAAVAGVLAAALPARRAARINVVSAIASS